MSATVFLLNPTSLSRCRLDGEYRSFRTFLPFEVRRFGQDILNFAAENENFVPVSR
jgi:hypothetical protein